MKHNMCNFAKGGNMAKSDLPPVYCKFVGEDKTYTPQEFLQIYIARQEAKSTTEAKEQQAS
jgi:hypothetical protein